MKGNIFNNQNRKKVTKKSIYKSEALNYAMRFLALTGIFVFLSA